LSEAIQSEFLKILGPTAAYLDASDDKQKDWRLVCDGAAECSSSLRKDFLDFYRELFLYHGKSTDDFSVIFYQNKKPFGIWPVQVLRPKDGLPSLMSVDQTLEGPIYVAGVAEKTKKDMAKTCIKAALQLARSFGLNEIKCTEQVRKGPISAWQRQLNFFAMESRSHFELYVNLSLGLEEIRAGLRKSHKWRVNEASKAWKSEVFYGNGESDFADFKKMHLEVSGRETRSQETWDTQLRALLCKDAFLVSLRDEGGKYVGGGYYMLSKSDARYGVAAYDRALFDKALGHLCVWEAIKYAQQLGCKWMYLGPQLTSTLHPQLSAKELSISEFKEGFANEAYIRVESTVSTSVSSQPDAAD
jgi:FemAB family protein